MPSKPQRAQREKPCVLRKINSMVISAIKNRLFRIGVRRGLNKGGGKNFIYWASVFSVVIFVTS